MSEFYVTFGEQYRHEPHPTFEEAHPDGWVTIVAPDEEVARAAAFRLLGKAWSFMYGELLDPGQFPRGELRRLDAGCVAAPSAAVEAQAETAIAPKLRVRRHADGRIALLDDPSKEWTVIVPGFMWAGRRLDWAHEEDLSGPGWAEAVVLFPTAEDAERLARAKCAASGHDFDDVYEEPDEFEVVIENTRDALGSLASRGGAR